MASTEVGIVVIEDDHHISDLVAMYLRRDGFRVVQADDAERGLAAIDRESPRLVILDLGLPGRARRARRLPTPGRRRTPASPSSS